MAPSPTSKTTAASIPNITALRQSLDYAADSQRCIALYDDMRAFRRKFHTSQGIAGIDLHDWKSREHQAGLAEMADSYLEKEGNGRLFWPDDDASPNRNKYRYSVDAPRINRLIKQLFFRLNQQQFRNIKYKHKDIVDPKAPDQRGRSVETAIDLDGIQAIPPSTSKPAPAGSVPKRKPAKKAASTSKHSAFLRSNNATMPTQQGSFPNEDVYDVPESESSRFPAIRSFKAMNRAAQMRHNLHNVNATAQAYQAKSSKEPPTTSSEKNDEASTKRKAAEIEQLATWSPRSRKKVQHPGYVGLEGMNEVIDGDSSIGGSPSTSNQSLRATVEDANDERDDPFATPSLPPSTGTHPSGLAGEDAPFRPDTGDGDEILISERSQPHFEVMTTPSSVVSPSRDASEQPIQQPAPHSTTVTPGPRLGSDPNRPKPSVTFIYRVINSQNASEKLVQTWQPRGRFQDKSLAELLEELPFGDPAGVRGLVFAIDLPGMQVVERILRDNEDGFESMKRLINKTIRDWFSRKRRSGEDAKSARLVVDVFIETMVEENKEGADKGDDIDVIWW